MFKFLKSNKGMSLIEVIISLAMLAVVMVPLMMGFLNVLMVTKLTKQQTEVNAVSAVVKEQVTEAVIQDNYPIPYVVPVAGETELRLRDFIGKAIAEDPTALKTSDNLAIVDSNGQKNEKYFYIVSYKHESCYDGANYPYTYHVIISILTTTNEGTEKVVNTFKIAANAGVLPGVFQPVATSGP